MVQKAAPPKGLEIPTRAGKQLTRQGKGPGPAASRWGKTPLTAFAGYLRAWSTAVRYAACHTSHLALRKPSRHVLPARGCMATSPLASRGLPCGEQLDADRAACVRG